MKQIVIEMEDEHYALLQASATSFGITVEELARSHVWDVAIGNINAHVLQTRFRIAQAIKKAKEFEPGKIFTAKDIVPEGVKLSDLAGFSRHIHTALQSDSSFVKLEEERNPLIRYSRV